MRIDVRPLATGDLVDLVNAWATRPREVGARLAPTGQPDRTAVADRVFAVFAAAPAQRARLVNDMLDEAGVRPGLTVHDGGFVTSWWVPDRHSAMFAAAALTLREHIASTPERLGICADNQCTDVYVDTSPAGHRRFCSPTCQTRTRVAAFRERRRNAVARVAAEDSDDGHRRARRPSSGHR